MPIPIAPHFPSVTSYSKLVHLLFLPGGLDLAWVRIGEKGQRSRTSIMPTSQFFWGSDDLTTGHYMPSYTTDHAFWDFEYSMAVRKGNTKLWQFSG